MGVFARKRRDPTGLCLEDRTVSAEADRIQLRASTFLSYDILEVPSSRCLPNLPRIRRGDIAERTLSISFPPCQPPFTRVNYHPATCNLAYWQRTVNNTKYHYLLPVSSRTAGLRDLPSLQFESLRKRMQRELVPWKVTIA